MMVTQLRSIRETRQFVDNLMDVDDHNPPDLKKYLNVLVNCYY